jgi:hypothetical protein
VLATIKINTRKKFYSLQHLEIEREVNGLYRSQSVVPKSKLSLLSKPDTMAMLPMEQAFSGSHAMASV